MKTLVYPQIEHPDAKATDSLGGGCSIGGHAAVILEFNGLPFVNGDPIPEGPAVYVAWRSTPTSLTTVQDKYFAATSDDWNEMRRLMQEAGGPGSHFGDARWSHAALDFFDRRGWV